MRGAPAIEPAGGARQGGEPPGAAWTRLPFAVLFFLMLFAPTVLQSVKAALLGAVLLFAMAAAARGRSGLHRSVAAWMLALVALGLAFMLRGALRGEPGAFEVGTVYVVWPLAFSVVVACGHSLAHLRLAFVVLAVATAALSLHGIAFVLQSLGYLPASLPLEYASKQHIGLYDGYVELSLSSIGTLVFAVPFTFAALVSWSGLRRRAVHPSLLWIGLLAGLVLAALSGRRALLLVCGIAPLFTFVFGMVLPRSERRRILRASVRSMSIAAAGLALLVLWAGSDVYEIRPQAMWEMFTEGFDPRVSDAMSIRAVQFQELLRQWAERPWLGAGHGAFLREHVRDPLRPWSYELSYVALLFQTGVVGCALYVGLCGWIGWELLRMVRSGGLWGRTALPVLVGLATFMLANATNPYLVKFDFMWVVFLPLALVNAWRLERSAEHRRAPAGGPRSWSLAGAAGTGGAP